MKKHNLFMGVSAKNSVRFYLGWLAAKAQGASGLAFFGLFRADTQDRIKAGPRRVVAMKLRILSYHVPGTHDLITPLPSINDPVSISDFDAFVFDPEGLRAEGVVDIGRRRRELNDLVQKKGGLVICVLRPAEYLSAHTNYALLDAMAPGGLVAANAMPGAGSQVVPVPSARGASTGYFQVLKGSLRFAAHLEVNALQMAALSGTVFAHDSVGHPIAVEFRVGEGVLSFVPALHEATGDRLGAAIVKMATTHFNKPTEIAAPSWAEEISVPGSTVHDERIAELEKTREQLRVEISELEGKRDEVLSYMRLLFGYGKAVLEPAVRTGLRLTGFAVQEPEDYQGEWDVELVETQSGRTAIGEVEGSEGVIDIDKYRQLLDYIQGEAIEGRDHKGILIGNGFRLTTPDAPERREQFSQHAIRGAKKNGFCLLPTTELFKAVCALLESPGDECLRIKIRDSVLTTVGVWTFINIK